MPPTGFVAMTCDMTRRTYISLFCFRREVETWTYTTSAARVLPTETTRAASSDDNVEAG